MNEENIISISKKKFFSTLGYANIIKGIGDDTAVIASADSSLYQLVTIDTIVEGTHFTFADKPEEIGYKAVAVNASDIAAMGGVPKYMVVSATLPRNAKSDYIEKITKGLKNAADLFKIAVVGGDTVGGKILSVTVTMFGEVEKENVCYRSEAKAGEVVVVTGKLGDSLKSGRHLNFKPRLKEARWLVKNAKPSAMMDLSDGLAKDGNRLAKASNVFINLNSKNIPINHNSNLNAALTDGEDFELLFTISELSEEKIKIFEKEFGIPLTIIGEVKEKTIGLFLDEKKIEPKGFDHFLYK